jgi:hypothetical protein
VKTLRPVNAKAFSPPPLATTSDTNVPDGQGGDEAVTVKIPCGTCPEKSTTATIVTGTGGVAPAGCVATTAAVVARSSDSFLILASLEWSSRTIVESGS